MTDKEINITQESNSGDNNVDINLNKPINTKLLPIIDLLCNHFKDYNYETVNNFDSLKVGTIKKIEINQLDEADLKELDAKVLSGSISLDEDFNTTLKKAKFITTANRIYRQNYKTKYIAKEINSNDVLYKIMTDFENIVKQSEAKIDIEDIKECVEHLVYYAFIDCGVLEKDDNYKQ